MSLDKIRATATAALVGFGVLASGAVLLTRPTVAAPPARTEAASPAKPVEPEAAGALPETEAHLDRGLEPSAARHRVLFERILYVLADHCGQITSANVYEGRVETRQRFGNWTAVVAVAAAEEGGYLVRVRVFHEAADGKPTRRDVELERAILQRLRAQPEGRPGQAPPPPAEAPVDADDGRIRALQKEVNELRERVRALKRRPSDREQRPLPPKDGR